VSYASQDCIYLIKNTVKNIEYREIILQFLNNCSLFDFFKKKCIVINGKADFLHHYYNSSVT